MSEDIRFVKEWTSDDIYTVKPLEEEQANGRTQQKVYSKHI